MGSSLSSLVFQPPRVTYTQAENSQLFWLHTESATQIPALHIDNGAKLTILFSHGNAEDLGMIYDWMTFFSMELRVNVLAYDYQGYGRAGGSCSERACYEDIDAAYRFLTTQLQIPSANIVLYGRSLGSGPSLYLAEKLGALGERIGGIILQVRREKEKEKKNDRNMYFLSCAHISIVSDSSPCRSRNLRCNC